MRRHAFLLFLGSCFSLAAAVVAVVAIVGITELTIGPVAWTFNDRYGIHAGDVVIASIAAFLVSLYTIGLGLAVREAGRDHGRPR